MSSRTILLVACISFLLLAGNPVLSSPDDNITSWGRSYDDIFAIPTPQPYGGWSYDEIFTIPTPKPYGGWSYDEIFAIPDYKPMFNRSWNEVFQG